MYVGVTPTPSKPTDTLLPAVERDALIHTCLSSSPVVSEQSVGYWGAFHDASVDPDGIIIFL